jgi:hypothetical protein
MTIRELRDVLNDYPEDDLDNEIFVAIGDDDGTDIIAVEDGVAATFIIGKEN